MDTVKLECFATVAQLKAALLFAPKDDRRYYLNGLCVEHGPTGARIIATDGRRMIVVNLGDPFSTAVERTHVTAVGKSVQYIIARELVERAVKAYAKVDQALRITFDAPRVAIMELGADAIDGNFPDYQRVVPGAPTGETSQYNWAYLADCNKAAGLLKGLSPKHPNCLCSVAYNGTGPALIDLAPDAFAVVMPMRGEAASAPPAWFTAAAAPLALAEAA